ncbi:MAG TPA: STAS domain-containing protein [Bryobacteraceae bacterium]|nr:STAS domain-containing protein [Bryobacteraceae bacterium]
MAMDMVFEEIAPGTVVLPLSGKLMLGQGGGQIVSHVEELLRQGKRTFIFDLSAVSAIDSTGIGHFIASFNKIMAAGGEMRMAGATGHVLESFRVSLLDTVFRFFPNVETARSA